MYKKIQIVICFFLGVSIFGCKQDQEYQYIFEVNEESLYQSNIEKTKQKTTEQYISILYANLFATTLPQQDLGELAEVRTAIGDKQTADELILNNFVNGGNANIPTDQEMRADIEKFIEATYIRFFLRLPTPYEIFQLKEEIESDLELSPELIYQAFALSNEYKFY